MAAAPLENRLRMLPHRPGRGGNMHGTKSENHLSVKDDPTATIKRGTIGLSQLFVSFK